MTGAVTGTPEIERNYVSNVLLSITDGVGTISLNRPNRHNAVTDAMSSELAEVWDTVVADSAVRVIVMRGEGPSFCSGRDLAELGNRALGESDLSVIRRHQRLRVEQLATPKPFIAALRGHVLGGGLETALAADIRIAATDARLAFPEIRYGLMTDTGGAPLTTMLAGPSRAKWMLMTGRPVDALTALQWGLVDVVVEPGDLDSTAASLALELAGRPTEALALVKQTIDGIWHGALQAGLRSELVSQAALFGGEDYKARKAARAGDVR
jgi:enoyl-CoA hydratase/carnithine racemase